MKAAREGKPAPARVGKVKSKRAAPARITPTLTAIRAELHELGNPVRGAHSQRFFKTGPGQYGEGDKFLGLSVPEMRAIVRRYRELDDAAVHEMLQSPWHEERLVALLLMVEAYDRGDDSRRAHIHRTYLANTARINNWDLVDATAGTIVGQHLESGDITLLERLARSQNLWDRRIAIVSTFHFIKRDEFRPTFKIATLLLGDSAALIHKATGWMLREVGKRDRTVLDRFLKKHYKRMPRTMLRYAIERHPERVRKQYLAGTI